MNNPFDLYQNKDAQTEQESHRLRVRIAVMLSLFGAILLTFAGVLYNVQVVHGEEYLDNTALVFDQLQKQGVAGLSLLMPWFDLEYAGKEGQERLPGWNSMLAQLCMVKNVMVLDTYTPFQADPSRFFNEKLTPRRHYSKDACRMIAEMAFAAIAPMITE